MTIPNLLSPTQHPIPDNLLAGLSNFQRLLLITDGTVTRMLEQYLQEAIKVNKLYEKIEHCHDRLFMRHQPYIDHENIPVMQREVVLQGQRSFKNWIHAESSIVLENLKLGFRTDLLTSREPIGSLWEKYQVETFKSIVAFEQCVAGKLARYFQIEKQDMVISRTYRVQSGGKLIMVISETFPASFFRE